MNVCHAAVVEIPRGDFAHHLLDNGFWMNLTVLGDLCWAIAYILIIRQCFRQRTYGLPLVAIVMNFTWELQYSLVQPPRCDNGSVDVVKVAMILAWAVLDTFIVWQLFRYGRAEQTIKEIQRFFPFVVVGSLLLALAGNFAFARFHPEEAAPLSGLIINFARASLRAARCRSSIFLRPRSGTRIPTRGPRATRGIMVGSCSPTPPSLGTASAPRSRPRLRVNSASSMETPEAFLGLR